MEREYVQSSNLVSVGYDPDGQVLEIEFNGGRVYAYLNVPQFEFDRLMASTSKGQYFNSQIKDAYVCERR